MFGINRDVLAIKVGELSAKVDTLTKQVEALHIAAQREPQPAIPSPIEDAGIGLLVERLSRGDPHLYKHLQAEVKRLKAQGADHDQIAEVLSRGSTGTAR